MMFIYVVGHIAFQLQNAITFVNIPAHYRTWDAKEMAQSYLLALIPLQTPPVDTTTFLTSVR